MQVPGTRGSFKKQNSSALQYRYYISTKRAVHIYQVEGFYQGAVSNLAGQRNFSEISWGRATLEKLKSFQKLSELRALAMIFLIQSGVAFRCRHMSRHN